MRYKALQTIWSPSQQRTYAPGEEFPLDNSSAEEIDFLVACGLVAEIAGEEPDEDEPTSGTIDLADGVDEAEASLAGRALRGRHKK